MRINRYLSVSNVRDRVSEFETARRTLEDISKQGRAIIAFSAVNVDRFERLLDDKLIASHVVPMEQ